MTTDSNRPWFRWSLRTMFVVATVLQSKGMGRILLITAFGLFGAFVALRVGGAVGMRWVNKEQALAALSVFFGAYGGFAVADLMIRWFRRTPPNDA